MSSGDIESRSIPNWLAAARRLSDALPEGEPVSALSPPEGGAVGFGGTARSPSGVHKELMVLQ